MLTGIKESCKIDEQIENGGCAVTTEEAEAILRNMRSGIRNIFIVCPGIKERSKTIDTKEDCKIDRIHLWERERYYQDFGFSSRCPQLPVISTYQEQEAEIANTKHEIIQEEFEMLKERLERKRRSMDRLSYNGCSQSLVRPTYQEQEPEISSPKHGWMFIGEVEAEMESLEEQERGQPRGIEECWLFMRTHSGWFNPPSRTTYKEQEQVKEDNFKRIQDEAEAEMESLAEQERLERKRRHLGRWFYSGCSQLLVRPTYRVQEPEILRDVFNIEHERKQDEFEMFKECKEKTSNVNGPEIQQPNQDAIDKEQQPGQHFIGVGKSRQTAKGVNMKLEMSFPFLKYSLILILVGFPVAGCNHQDFKWLPTNTTVKEVFQKDASLVWRYQSNLTLDKIDISRKKTEYEKEHVTLWTPDVGSKPNTLLSTDVTLEHRKEGDVGTIILTLVDPYPVDFDKQYYCTVSFEHGVDSMEIELQPYKVEYQPVADVVKARPGDDVQFVWIYKYPLPVTFVDFYKNDDIQNDILRWSRSDGVYDIEDEYKNRATVTVTTNKDQEEVTLTLRNVTRGDFDHKYCSLAIPANGYYSVSKITLRRLPVEEEKPKPAKKTISTIKKTIATPSSACRLSQVSMFLICSVLLLAV